MSRTPFTADDYLAWEAGQLERHEFIDGDVFAMGGAEDRHVTVCLNLAMALRQHLSGTLCRTFMSDKRLQVDAAHIYFYPDILVTCSTSDAELRQVKREPTLLVEVLSPSIEAYDRGDKFQRYRQIASLREYALVDIDQRRVDVFRKQADGHGLWVLHPFGAEAGITLASVGVTVSSETLYAELPD